MSTKWVNRIIWAAVGFVFLLGLTLLFGLRIDDGKLTQVVPIATRAQTAPLIDPSEVPSAATVGQTVRVQTYIRDIGAIDNAWLLAARLPSLLIVSGLIYLLLRFVVLIADRKPFHISNIRGMRVAAALLMLAPIVKFSSDWILRRQFIETSSISSLELASLKPSPGPLLAGLAVLIIAEAFASGRRAEKDVEGLV